MPPSIFLRQTRSRLTAVLNLHGYSSSDLITTIFTGSCIKSTCWYTWRRGSFWTVLHPLFLVKASKILFSVPFRSEANVSNKAIPHSIDLYIGHHHYYPFWWTNYFQPCYSYFLVQKAMNTFHVQLDCDTAAADSNWAVTTRMFFDSDHYLWCYRDRSELSDLLLVSVF